MKTATLDEASRQNFIGRLEQERLGIAEKAKSHDANYRYFLLKHLNSVIGRVIDHRDHAAFLHTREGFRSGASAWECAEKEVSWMLAELRRQSDDYQSELNQLSEAA